MATCLWMFLKQMEEKSSMVKKDLEFVFYSDNFCGPNENRFIFIMYEYAIPKSAFVNSINRNFLVKELTQNEEDIAPTTIRRVLTKPLTRGPICTTQQYITLMRTAKKGQAVFHARNVSQLIL